MKHLRKSILTLLALTLFGGAGAWAQTETLLTTVTATGQTSYSQSPDGIVTVTLNNIEYYSDDYGWLWNGTVTVEAAQGYTITRCVIRQDNKTPIEDDLAPFTATMSSNVVSVETSTGPVNGNANQMDGISTIEVYGYEGSPEPAEIELTKAGDNQWTLGQTPDYDLELQVEYYEAHALKEIPAGWTVKVNDIDKTAAIVGDSLMITETDSVTLIPAGNPRRVKSVTLAEEPTVTFTVKRAYPGNTDGTYTVAAGTTWQQFLESGNAPACLSKSGQWILHDINNALGDCGGTNMLNTADNKYIRPGDAIIDGATYACDQYVDWQGHF